MILNAVYFLLNFFLIAQIEVFFEVHLVVKFKNVGYSGGNIESYDVGIAYSFECLYNTAKTVAVGHDHYFVVLLEGGKDGSFVVGHESCNGVAEGFGGGQFGIAYVGIAGVAAGVALVVDVQCRGLHVEAAAPLGQFLFAVLFKCFGFVGSFSSFCQ